MSTKSFLAVAVLSTSAALCGANAYAADFPVNSPYYKASPLPVYNWTGFYAGVNAGVGAGGTTDISDTGFAGGAQAGFNWQFAPQWVVGIEGDIGYLGINGSFFTEGTTAIKTDWYGTIRGRLGYTNGPSLFYATGGAAFVHVKDIVDLSILGIAPVSSSKTASGWTLGGGIETLLGGSWSAKAEYLYIDSGEQNVVAPVFDVTDQFKNHFQVYRYGLNYKFGGPSVSGPLPAHNWNGFYAGMNAGANLSEIGIRGATSGIDAHDTTENLHFSGGAQVGYNWQFSPNWIAGLEGDIGFLGTNRVVNFIGLWGIKADGYGTIRGRLGYSTGPTLLYATGGAAFVNVKNSVQSTAPPFTFVSKSETATGWTVGGGIEAALAQNWTAKTEYLYIDAGSQDVVNTDAIPNGAAHFDNRFHIFRVGLNYQFGGY